MPESLNATHDSVTIANVRPQPSIRLCGTATVGPKGQIVIPKEVRDKLSMRPGDSVTVLIKDERFIGIVKNDDLQSAFEYAKAEGILFE